MVASGVSPDVEGTRPAARIDCASCLGLTKVSGSVGLADVFFHRAGRHGSTAGRDACRYEIQFAQT
jgi:hypothetical protein